MKKEFLRVGEIVKLLKITPQTIRKYQVKVFIKGFKIPGEQILCRKETEANHNGALVFEEKPKRIAFYV